MSAISASGTGYAIEGIMYEYDSGRAIKRHFHVYGEGDIYLGHGKTGRDGRFYLRIRQPAELQEKITLTFRLCKQGNPVHRHAKLGQDAALCRNFSFYSGRMEVGESVETFVLDRLSKDLGAVHMQTSYKKEKVPLRYKLHLAKATVPAKATALMAQVKEKLDIFDTHGIDDVVQAFDVSPTDLTPENTWKLITNGICPLYLKDEGEYLLAEADWSRYEFDKLRALADVRVWFKKNGKSDPIMDRIEVKFRKTLEPSSRPEDYTGVQIYLPGQPGFKEGLRIANCAFHVLGQTTFHLGIGHVYGANAAVAAFDYLAGHPLGNLLLPHCHFIRKISKELGGPIIFEADGVLNVSALSVKGIATMISDSLAALDPFSFVPRSPINDGHLFAKAQSHHFAVLKAAVGEYFDTHWEGIKADWAPVHGFFRRMFKGSPTYRPWGGLDPDVARWRDSSEIGGQSGNFPPRMKYRAADDGVRSFRVVAAEEFGPLPGDREMIERFVVDFIHHVTIWHSLIHRSQYVASESNPSIRDVGFAPLTLSNYGREEHGGISVGDATKQMEVVGIFSGFDVKPYALVDSKDVYPGLVRRVKAASEGYFAAGIDPFRDIQVSTVI